MIRSNIQYMYNVHIVLYLYIAVVSKVSGWIKRVIPSFDLASSGWGSSEVVDPQGPSIEIIILLYVLFCFLIYTEQSPVRKRNPKNVPNNFTLQTANPFLRI